MHDYLHTLQEGHTEKSKSTQRRSKEGHNCIPLSTNVFPSRQAKYENTHHV